MTRRRCWWPRRNVSSPSPSAAQKLRLTDRTVMARIRKGWLRADKVGRNYIFPATDVESLPGARPGMGPAGSIPTAAAAKEHPLALPVALALRAAGRWARRASADDPTHRVEHLPQVMLTLRLVLVVRYGRRTPRPSHRSGTASWPSSLLPDDHCQTFEHALAGAASAERQCRAED